MLFPGYDIGWGQGKFASQFILYNLDSSFYIIWEISTHYPYSWTLILNRVWKRKLEILSLAPSMGDIFHRMAHQLTTPSLDSPVSNWDAQGLAHQSIGLNGLAEERAVVPHAAQVVHTAVHKSRGIHNSAALPEGAVRLVEEATVVRTKVEGLGGCITLSTIVYAARATLPVSMVDSPALA